MVTHLPDEVFRLEVAFTVGRGTVIRRRGYQIARTDPDYTKSSTRAPASHGGSTVPLYSMVLRLRPIWSTKRC